MNNSGFKVVKYTQRGSVRGTVSQVFAVWNAFTSEDAAQAKADELNERDGLDHMSEDIYEVRPI